MDADLVDLAARYAIGDVFVDDLPAVAVDALLRGVDSPSLVLLAGVSGKADPGEVWALFLGALAELQIPVPPRKSAAERLKVSYARKVLAGEWSPREAAQKFVYLHQALEKDVADRHHVGDGLDVSAMIGAHYSYAEVVEGDVAATRAIDGRVLSECRRLVGGAGPRER